MTNNNHPITPPRELVKEWMGEIWHEGTPIRVATSGFHIANQAARWGADQELEVCLKEIRDGAGRLYIDEFKLRVCLADDIWTARRLKPPSLKEQALETLRSMQIEPVILDGINVNKEVMDKYDIIRRALESLPD